jgi:hypothetical protein
LLDIVLPRENETGDGSGLLAERWDDLFAIFGSPDD